MDSVKYFVKISRYNKPVYEYTTELTKDALFVYGEKVYNLSLASQYKRYFLNSNLQNIDQWVFNLNESKIHMMELCDEYFADCTTIRIE